jgi:hypothetical protein
MTHNCIEGVMITSEYRKTGAKDKVAPMRGPREKPKTKEKPTEEIMKIFMRFY